MLIDLQGCGVPKIPLRESFPIVLQLFRVQVVHADRAAAVAAVAGQRRLGFDRAWIVVRRHCVPISFNRCGAG